MTDSAWKKLIEKAANLAKKHQAAMRESEAEYERRYGHNPSDIDDDWWIDTVHLGGNVDLDAIKKNAELSVKRRKGIDERG